MASRRFDEIQTIGLHRRKVIGSFAPAGSGAVTDVRGKGFSVARTGAGENTITFEDSYVELLSHIAGIQHTSAVDLNPQFGDFVAASKTIILRTLAAGTPTDIAADPNSRVSFEVTFRDTSLKD